MSIDLPPEAADAPIELRPGIGQTGSRPILPPPPPPSRAGSVERWGGPWSRSP